MCGLVAFAVQGEGAAMAMDALGRLEYRGYDSAGLARIDTDGIERRRASGKLDNLRAALKRAPMATKGGHTLWLGHTRWATHGPPSERNAHPHQVGQVVCAHNGVIENFRFLKAGLVARGAHFASDTDTEVAVHLVVERLAQGATPIEAVRHVAKQLEGAFAMAFAFGGTTPRLVAVQHGAPLAIGRGTRQDALGSNALGANANGANANGANGAWLASDSIAFAPYAQEVAHLETGDIAWLDGQDWVVRANGAEAPRAWAQVAPNQSVAGKGRWRHHMAREIHEQPETLVHALSAGLDLTTERAVLGDARLAQIKRARLVGCGSAALAAQVGADWMERLARIPARAETASEFRYRDPALEAGLVLIGVSQSGETADTLAATRLAKAQGLAVAAVVNVETSTMAREADWVLPTRAGIEVAVASTKTFTAQLITLAALVLRVGRANGAIDKATERMLVRALLEIPAAMAQTLAECDGPLRVLARRLAQAHDVIFVGRNASASIAKEGALKMKELAYIHAEGFAAGELKHGPLALLDKDTPVVAFAGGDKAGSGKLAASLYEAAARAAPTFLVGDAESLALAGDACEGKIALPSVHPIAAPMLQALAAQLLAYHAGVARGADVDQPRNLAKSVTVE